MRAPLRRRDSCSISRMKGALRRPCGSEALRPGDAGEGLGGRVQAQGERRQEKYPGGRA